MLDKLFVRVRSWLHNDPTGTLGDPATGDGPQKVKKNGKASAKASGHATPPPPLPPDAWNEAESGMVITESGIIIIDPSAVEANRAAPPRPASMTVPADSAWALPNLPRAGAPAPAAAATTAAPSDPGSLNWDEVLARAKSRISAVPDPKPAEPPSKQTRGK